MYHNLNLRKNEGILFMRQILRSALTAAIAFMSALIMSICVSAETEDVEMPVVKAQTTSGGWGQSIVYDRHDFDCSRMTPDTIVKVEFELDGEWTGNGAPVELILFNYTTADPQIWAKATPFEWDETTASFNYEEMVKKFGTDDFTTVDNLCLGDCGIVMTVTKFTITNCKAVEIITTTSETTTASIIEITDPVTEITTASSASSESDEISFIMAALPFIVVGTIMAAFIVTVLIIVFNKKKKSY